MHDKWWRTERDTHLGPSVRPPQYPPPPLPQTPIQYRPPRTQARKVGSPSSPPQGSSRPPVSGMHNVGCIADNIHGLKVEGLRMCTEDEHCSYLDTIIIGRVRVHAAYDGASVRLPFLVTAVLCYHRAGRFIDCARTYSNILQDRSV